MHALGGSFSEWELRTFIGDTEVSLQHTVSELCVDSSRYLRRSLIYIRTLRTLTVLKCPCAFNGVGNVVNVVSVFLYFPLFYFKIFCLLKFGSSLLRSRGMCNVFAMFVRI